MGFARAFQGPGLGGDGRLGVGAGRLRTRSMARKADVMATCFARPRGAKSVPKWALARVMMAPKSWIVHAKRETPKWAGSGSRLA